MEIIKNKYKLLTIIGQGAYGIVYLGYDLQTKQKVAIKKFINIFEEKEDVIKLARQLKILRLLKHINIVRILDLFKYPKDSDDLYLVMERYTCDLEYYMHSNHYLKANSIKKIMYSLISAISYMHSSGIIHRDLKLGNILINKNCNIKICDFDLAKSIIDIAKDDSFETFRNDLISDKLRALSNKNILVERLKEENITKNNDQKNFEFIRDQPLENLTKNQDEISLLLKKSKQVRSVKRRLSQHVFTRWYRPPEVILLENYSFYSDIWSAGCIFAELLHMQKKSGIHFSNRSCFLSGFYCYPLSPNLTNLALEKDQLNLILNKVGISDREENDFSFITNERALQYVKSIKPIIKKDLVNQFPYADHLEIDLLTRMLEFNPFFRLSAEECLLHPYFQNTVDKIPFCSAKEKIIVDFDLKESVSKEDLLKVIDEEISFYDSKFY